jgi:hypothetical protein
MTLRRRLDRLEARTPTAAPPAPLAVLRPIVTPCVSWPVLVAAMLRWAGDPWRYLTPEPGEALGAFMAWARGVR